MLELKAGKNRIFTKMVSMVLAQAFLLATLASSELPISYSKDLNHSLNMSHILSNLRKPMDCRDKYYRVGAALKQGSNRIDSNSSFLAGFLMSVFLMIPMPGNAQQPMPSNNNPSQTVVVYMNPQDTWEVFKRAKDGDKSVLNTLFNQIVSGSYEAVNVAGAIDDEPFKEAIQKFDPKVFADKASQGIIEAVSALVMLDNWFGNILAKEYIRKIDTKVFIDKILNGDPDTLVVSDDLAPYNQTFIENIAKLDPKVHIDKALQGDTKSIDMLYFLASHNNQIAAEAFIMLGSKGNIDVFRAVFRSSGSFNNKEFLTRVNFKALIEKAHKGDEEAIRLLGSTDLQNNSIVLNALFDLVLNGSVEAVEIVSRSSSVSAREFIENFNTEGFIQRALRGEISARRACDVFLRIGNRHVLANLVNAGLKGDKDAIKRLYRGTEVIVWNLRTAHLDQRIPDSELSKRLTQESFNNNPLFLYVSYISRENFGVLAKMIFERLNNQAEEKGMSVHSYIQQLDPDNIFYEDFILQAANFSMLGEMIATPNALYKIMDYLFKDLSKETMEDNSVRLALFVEAIISDKKFGYQKEFQSYLRSLYNNTAGLSHELIAGLLVVYKDKLEHLNKDDIYNIAARHDIVDEEFTIPYDKLRKNHKLVIHIVFADDDAVKGGHFEATSRFFQGKDPRFPSIGGYRVVSSAGNSVILEKGNTRLVLIKANEENYDINKHLDKISMVISRSHAGAERQVFKEQETPVTINGTIGFISACRSASVEGRISKAYPGMAFILVNGVAEGVKTNIATYYFLEGLNRGFRTYKAIKTFIKPHLKNDIQNFVFPGDPSLRVKKIIQKYIFGNTTRPVTGLVAIRAAIRNSL